MSSRAGEHRFFTVLTALLAAGILCAFIPSYFLRTLFHRPAPTPFIAVHAVLMTLWMLALVGQSLLVAAGAMRWHRRLGYALAVLAALIVPVGCMGVLASAAHEVHAASPFARMEIDVVSLELTQMALFGGFVAAAIVLRTRGDWHKRLILIATLALVPNALVRLSFTPLLAFLDTNLLTLHAWAVVVAAVVGSDVWRTRRLHPAFLVGAPIAAIFQHAARLIGLSPVWVAFWTRSLA